MIDIQIAFGKKFCKDHFKQKDQRATIDARSVGGIHGDGNAMCFGINREGQLMDLVIDDGGNDRRGKVIFDPRKELPYLYAAQA